MATKLPKWLKANKDGSFSINPDLAYPAVLNLLGVKEDVYDQYWLEVAFQCTKLAVQELVRGSELDPGFDKPLVLHIETADGQKERWRLADFPVGKGITAASKGLEAKKIHYPKIARRLAAS